MASPCMLHAVTKDTERKLLCQATELLVSRNAGATSACTLRSTVLASAGGP